MYDESSGLIPTMPSTLTSQSLSHEGSSNSHNHSHMTAGSCTMSNYEAPSLQLMAGPSNVSQSVARSHPSSHGKLNTIFAIISNFICFY